MNSRMIFLLLFSTSCYSDGYLQVLHIDSLAYTTSRTVYSSIRVQDSVKYFESEAPKIDILHNNYPYEVMQDTRRIYLQGITKEVASDGNIIAIGKLSSGAKIGRWIYYDTNTPDTTDFWKIETYNDKSECITTEYFENGVLVKKENPKSIKHRESLVEDYRYGLQPPTNIDGAYPTGLTLSGFNLHCDIPSVQHGDSRSQILLASEVGVRGGAFRLGLSPFRGRLWSTEYINFTPITINGSMTYLWNAGDSYRRLDPLENHHWYMGGDIDFSYLFGHVRFGLFRMVNPETIHDQQVRFMFSIGASPALFFISKYIPFAG